MERVLISACLLGQPVRYNYEDARVADQIITRWISEGRIVGVCPEFTAGFGVPRPAAEIVGIGGAAVLDGVARVIEAGGNDVTPQFVAGAQAALELTRANCIHIAVLTDGSPSCGTSYVCDGTFRGGKTYGQIGVTAALLHRRGIAVFSQFALVLADQQLRELDNVAGVRAEQREDS